MRLDQLLVDRGLATSRSQAQALILAAQVELEGAPNRSLKPGQQVQAQAHLQIVQGPRWASRAGAKLEGALDVFAIDPTGHACLDAGASTGGFTDVLLERGARVVYAVDAGRGQLIDRLRRDPRVVSMERNNLRDLQTLPEPIDIATLDLSFISLRLVLPAAHRLLADAGRAVCLVKPQFEAGRGSVPRGGVVRDPAVHKAVLVRFGEDAMAAGFSPSRLMRSPVVGTEGNVEFLALLERNGEAGGEAEAWGARVDALGFA